jgi:alpha-N-arabinofuranosidase
MLITLLKNAGQVKIACLAQLVNVIAPIMTEIGGSVWRQTIFYPFMHASAYGRGTVLLGPVNSEKYDSKEYSDIPYMESVAVHNGEKEELAIFAVNRNLTGAVNLEASVYGFEGYTFLEHISMYHPDLKAVNSARGEIVKPEKQQGGRLDGTALSCRLAPASWNVIRLKKRK